MPLPDDAMTVIGQRLRVDSWTVEAIDALRAQHIRVLLLKGPAIARWLYPNAPHARPYADADLLVASDRIRAAAAVLESLGYEMHGTPAAPVDEPHARHFYRRTDAAAVDLHRAIHCTEHVDAGLVWNTLASRTQTLAVAGVNVEIPNAAVRALHLALHLGPYDGRESQQWRDLDRAVRVIDAATWSDAAQIARSLGIEADLGARLQRVPAARELVRALALPQDHDIEPVLPPRAATGIVGLGSLMRLSTTCNRRSQLRYVQAKLFPPTPFVLARQAKSNSGPLAAAHGRIAWLAHCARHLPRAARAWRRISATPPRGR